MGVMSAVYRGMVPRKVNGDDLSAEEVVERFGHTAEFKLAMVAHGYDDAGKVAAALKVAAMLRNWAMRDVRDNCYADPAMTEPVAAAPGGWFDPKRWAASIDAARRRQGLTYPPRPMASYHAKSWNGVDCLNLAAWKMAKALGVAWSRIGVRRWEDVPRKNTSKRIGAMTKEKMRDAGWRKCGRSIMVHTGKHVAGRPRPMMVFEGVDYVIDDDLRMWCREHEP